MKNIYMIFAGMVAMSTAAFAQPVITSSLTTVPLGTIDTAYGASPTVLPGAGGAGVTWDMSTVTTAYAAKLTVVDPSTTPYASTFPGATFCAQVDGTSTSYNYNRQTSIGVENLTTTYAGVGTGKDYSPNPRLSVPFPFSYTDERSDTFQSTTSGADTVRLIYDGYGSLITPFNTYSSVIRIKEDYGTKYSYSWYNVTPFVMVMNYSSSSNNYVIVKTHFATTGIANTPAVASAVIFPNPTSGNAVLRMDATAYNNASVTITDLLGKTVKQIPVTSAETTIQKEGLTTGLYFYSVQNNGVRIANGKLEIN